MIQAYPAQDRELAGINQARCRHEWKPTNIYRLMPDGSKYIQYSHTCQICLLPGNEVKNEE